MESISFALYSLLMRLAQPWLKRTLQRRAQLEPLYALHMHERFGDYGANPPPRASSRIWIHAVSLGETRAAAVLIEKLRQQLPGLQLLLTHGTATGRAEGAKLLLAGDQQAWLPWDTPHATKRFVAHFAPCVGVLMETEVWPNLCAALHKAGIPLVLANARLSEPSLQKALRLGSLSRPAFAVLSMSLAQTAADAQRLQLLGTPNVRVMGNLKFDAQIDTRLVELGRAWRKTLKRPVVMLAVSRDGEEQLFLEQIIAKTHINTAQYAPNSVAFRTIKTLADVAQGVQWLIVPRHPQRFDAVAQLIRATGLSVSLRSSWQAAPEAADVWLGDSMAEMALYYGLADVALLGGSFEPLGGQNLIEAIACGCPVIMGPHTFNFDQAALTAQELGAALRVAGMQEGVLKACAIAADSKQLVAMQATGRDWLSKSSGAAVRSAQAIAQLVR